ncbi:hypothetical protein DL95DRAFT_395524 [Leptodontidium sp. 2 PMI_412]|nr:hypothetical protein DL95DRAFT_395524 [Leptodontidium sp. 2 PMI_412]
MWGVLYNEYTSRERGRMDEDTLIRFQELASTLVGHANDLLGSEAFHDRRSDHYQQGRPKIGQIPVEDIPQGFSDHRSPGAKSPFQLEAPLLQNLNSSNIFDSMKTDTSSFEPVVLLLVAGAIFAVVIMFLEALRQTSNCFALHQIGTLQERYWILAAYLGLGNTGTQASFQIRQGEEDLHAGYSFSVY